jgi:hypothetical protein
MNNTEIVATSDTQDTGQNKHKSKQKGQSRMNNKETLETSDAQEEGQNKHKSKQKCVSDVVSVSVFSFLIVPSVYSSVYFVLGLVYPMLPMSLCFSFFIIPSVYSSIYFVLCLVYPMLPLSLCCSFLIVPSVYSSVYFVLGLVYPIQHRIHKTRYIINTRVNRRDNQEWTTHRHWQHRIHKTQYKINTRVNRWDNQEWTTQRQWQHVSCVSDVVIVSVFFILDCPICLL